MVVVLGSIHHQFITKSTVIISANISSSSSSVNKSQRSLFTRRNSSILATSTILSSFLHLASFQLANAREEEEAPQRQEERVVQVFEKASPSVVFIKDLELVKTSGKSTNEEEESAKVEGTGSGFIWDKSGHIVTNYHVIAKLATDTTGLQRCKVFLEDAHGQKFSKEGKLVGFDPTYDLAVLKIDVDAGNFDLKPALLGTSGDLRVGQNCFAIGNPYGYENTLTTGVVSGLAREIPSPNGSSIRGAIQTDAAINAGNSGGPLINSYGHVIGVNTSTFTRKGSGQSSGVNFAIPIDTVVRTVPYLIVYGTPYSNRY
ncbi:hypothetical protein MKX03_026371 [Papaver bracteatum]|nr:hypothetical protein MKX03_026371 [Papaver bracteatum]